MYVQCTLSVKNLFLFNLAAKQAIKVCQYVYTKCIIYLLNVKSYWRWITIKLTCYRLEGKKAAIGFIYEDSTPLPLKDEDSDSSDTDVEDADLGNISVVCSDTDVEYVDLGTIPVVIIVDVLFNTWFQQNVFKAFLLVISQIKP